MEKYIEKYRNYMSKVSREGAEDLTEYIINETDFFEAPASSKFHNNIKHGLIKKTHC